MNQVGHDHGRRRDIQGLRAIAVVSVVCFHAGLPIAGGFTGVDIFFVISGFVITAMLLREWTSAGSIDLRRFYVRRIKRLTPALALVALVTILLSGPLLSPLGEIVKVSALTGMASIVTVANLIIATMTGGYFDAAAEANPLLHTWSLSVEEQFYLAFPVILAITLAFSRKYQRLRGAPTIAVIAIGAASFAAAYEASAGKIQSDFWNLALGFYSPLSRAWEFAAGAVIALCGAPLACRSKSAANVIASIGLLLLAGSFTLISGETPFPGPMTLLPVLGTGAIIMAGSAPNIISRALSTKPMVSLGNVSYSWYLWHWPAIVFTKANGGSSAEIVAAAALSILPAVASYRFVENPIRFSSMPRRQMVACIAAFTVPVLVLAPLLIIANRKSYWSGAVVEYQAAVGTVHAGNAAGCGQGFVPPSLPDKTCTWNGAAKGQPIYLIGDSNADHLSEATIAAGENIGSPVSIVTKGGCAFIGKSWASVKDADMAKCLTFVDEILDLIDRSDPGVVVLALSDSIWWPGSDAVGATRQTETSDVPKVMAYLQGELDATVARIRARGHMVLLVQPVAKFITPDRKLLFDPSACTTISVVNQRCPLPVEVSVDYEDAFQRYARQSLASAARGTNSAVLDIRPYFCPNNRCSNVDERGILYRDAGHLTLRATLMLSGVLTDQISSIMPRSEARK